MLLTLKRKLPLSVPEAGSERSITEKENAVKALGTLSYPVTESNHLRTPTENSSDTDTPGKLPYPIPEENKKKRNWAKQRLLALLALKLQQLPQLVKMPLRLVLKCLQTVAVQRDAHHCLELGKS